MQDFATLHGDIIDIVLEMNSLTITKKQRKILINTVTDLIIKKIHFKSSIKHLIAKIFKKPIYTVNCTLTCLDFFLMMKSINVYTVYIEDIKLKLTIQLLPNDNITLLNYEIFKGV